MKIIKIISFTCQNIYKNFILNDINYSNQKVLDSIIIIVISTTNHVIISICCLPPFLLSCWDKRFVLTDADEVLWKKYLLVKSNTDLTLVKLSSLIEVLGSIWTILKN